MKLAPEDAHRLFDLIEDSLAPNPELSTREKFVDTYTTKIPDGHMILDDGHRVFVIAPAETAGGDIRFAVWANALVVHNNIWGDKLHAAHKVLDDAWFTTLP